MFRDVFLPVYVLPLGDVLVSISLTKKAAHIVIYSVGVLKHSFPFSRE